MFKYLCFLFCPFSLSFSAHRSAGENAKTIQELELSLKDALAYIEHEKVQAQELANKLLAEEARSSRL